MPIIETVRIRTTIPHGLIAEHFTTYLHRVLRDLPMRIISDAQLHHPGYNGRPPTVEFFAQVASQNLDLIRSHPKVTEITSYADVEAERQRNQRLYEEACEKVQQKYASYDAVEDEDEPAVVASPGPLRWPLSMVPSSVWWKLVGYVGVPIVLQVLFALKLRSKIIAATAD